MRGNADVAPGREVDTARRHLAAVELDREARLGSDVQLMAASLLHPRMVKSHREVRQLEVAFRMPSERQPVGLDARFSDDLTPARAPRFQAEEERHQAVTSRRTR